MCRMLQNGIRQSALCINELYAEFLWCGLSLNYLQPHGCTHADAVHGFKLQSVRSIEVQENRLVSSSSGGREFA